MNIYIPYVTEIPYRCVLSGYLVNNISFSESRYREKNVALFTKSCPSSFFSFFFLYLFVFRQVVRRVYRE